MTKKRRVVVVGSNLREVEIEEGSRNWSYICGVGFLALLVGWLNQMHVASLFENDRHFSHLSNLEREMTFRTEMGLYYSYFKTIVEADTFLDGAHKLYRNNVTEYPLVINTLKRFNLYPELLAGSLYRTFNSLGWLKMQCWTVNRGKDLEPVQSCEGLQDPPHFYIMLVFLLAGLTTTLLFLLGLLLSSSVWGGLLPVLAFFYNHGEATRVMWTPPLRESFAFPVCLAQVLAVSMTTRLVRPGWVSVLSVSFTTTLFIIFWQFAQFMLATQICALVVLHTLGVLPKAPLTSLLTSVTIGLLHSVALMFGNNMLFTSWLFSCLLSALLVFLPLESLTNSLKPLLKAVTNLILYIVFTIVFKISIAKAFMVQDDAHIFEILKSKFTDFKNFHTLLYTCAVEFDFLGWEMPLKATKTLLVPCALVVFVIFCFHFLIYLYNTFLSSDTKFEHLPIDPALAYNILQCLAFLIMAVLIMRLKLFLTPHLCLLTSMMASFKYCSKLFQSKQVHLGVLVGVVAVMSVQGIANLRDQQKIMGEYQNPQLEQLIEWIKKNLNENAVLAGPMPTMANLLLSTGRPIVNHPHYEDVGIRERTKQVYTVFSRKDPDIVLRNLQNLKVNYLILSGPWCLSTERNGCALTEVWDVEEPYLKENGAPPLCPMLWDNPPKPFKRVYRNNEYAVLQIPQRLVEVKPPKPSQQSI